MSTRGDLAHWWIAGMHVRVRQGKIPAPRCMGGTVVQEAIHALKTGHKQKHEGRP